MQHFLHNVNTQFVYYNTSFVIAFEWTKNLTASRSVEQALTYGQTWRGSSGSCISASKIGNVTARAIDIHLYMEYKSSLKVHLDELKATENIESHDWHGIKTLNNILDSCSREETHQCALARLKVLYVEVTRGWSTATAFNRCELDKQPNLPPIRLSMSHTKRSSKSKPAAGKTTAQSTWGWLGSFCIGWAQFNLYSGHFEAPFT